MKSFNKYFFSGNFVRDPQNIGKEADKPFAVFSVAVNNPRKNAAGQWEDETTFLDCKAFGHAANKILKYGSKGLYAVGEGRLVMDTWKDKESGKDRSKITVLVESIEVPNAKRDAPPERQPASDGGDYQLPF